MCDLEFYYALRRLGIWIPTFVHTDCPLFGWRSVQCYINEFSLYLDLTDETPEEVAEQIKKTFANVATFPDPYTKPPNKPSIGLSYDSRRKPRKSTTTNYRKQD